MQSVLHANRKIVRSQNVFVCIAFGAKKHSSVFAMRVTAPVPPDCTVFPEIFNGLCQKKMFVGELSETALVVVVSVIRGV